MMLDELRAQFAENMRLQHEKAAEALAQSAARSEQARSRHQAEMQLLNEAIEQGDLDDYLANFRQRIRDELAAELGGGLGQIPGGIAGDSQGLDSGPTAVGPGVDEG